MERRPIERVRGTQDLGTRAADLLHAVRARCEANFGAHGFRRIDVPVIEAAELHLRKSGLEMISKLYAFHDLGGRRVCLRPELTASIVRAAIASPAARLPDKVFATGPVFRYERPSRGRFRQFSQTGVEVLGATGPLADAEVIALAAGTLDELGITGYVVTIGNVGILSDVLGRLGLVGRRRTMLLESLEDARRHGIDAVRERLATLDPDVAAPRPTLEAGLPRPEAFSGAHPGAGGDRATMGEWEARTGEQAGEGVGAPGGDSVAESIARVVAAVNPGDLGRRTLDDVATRLVARMQGEEAHDAVERALSFVAALGDVRGDPAVALAAGRALLEAHALDTAPLAELAATLEFLEAFGIDRARLRIDLGLSRGLQYYTGMVFEIDHASLGAERQLCGGGRYDDLVRVLGGRHPVPATGFAFGLERLAMAREADDPTQAGSADALSGAPPATVLVVPASSTDAPRAIACAARLRRDGIAAALDTSGRTPRAAIPFAAREGFPAVAVVSGDDPPGTCRPRALSRPSSEPDPAASSREGSLDGSGQLARTADARREGTGGKSSAPRHAVGAAGGDPIASMPFAEVGAWLDALGIARGAPHLVTDPRR